MNKHQQLALLRLTHACHTAASRYCDVPMVWRIEQRPGSENIEVVGSNLECERRWFDEHRMLMATIGPRGGVRLFVDGTDPLYRRAV